MDLPHLPRSLAAALQAARSWGWPGALGAACLAASAAVAGLWWPMLDREAEARADALDATRLQAHRLRSQHARADSAEPAAQRFRHAFPLERDRQDRLAALLSLAHEHGLEARRSEYRLSQDDGLGLTRYSVSMPMSGPYPRLRAFVEDAQAHDPWLALDHLRMRRGSAGSSTVEAELAWTFYMQRTSQPPATHGGAR